MHRLGEQRTWIDAIGVALLAQLQANHVGALAGADQKYLHQLRVAIRRLRVLLSTCADLRPEHPWAHGSREAKWLAHKLGPARDNDVFVNEIWPRLRKRLQPRSVVDALDQQWLAERRRSSDAARSALRSPRYRRFMLKLEGLFTDGTLAGAETSSLARKNEQQPVAFARAQLRHRARRVAKLKRRWTAMDAQTTHRLRIAIKKLRYVVEFLGPLYKARRVKKMHNKLSKLQDILGAMHDIEVATTKVARALEQRAGEQREHFRKLLFSWQRSELKTLYHQARSAWKNYNDMKPFW